MTAKITLHDVGVSVPWSKGVAAPSVTQESRAADPATPTSPPLKLLPVARPNGIPFMQKPGRRRRSSAPWLAGPRRHQRCATSITSRDPLPGPASVNTRNGSRARTPSPIRVTASKVPAKATWRKVWKPATFTASSRFAGV